MLKNTIIDKHKKASQKFVVNEDAEKLASAAYVSCIRTFDDTQTVIGVMKSLVSLRHQLRSPISM